MLHVPNIRTSRLIPRKSRRSVICLDRITVAQCYQALPKHCSTLFKIDHEVGFRNAELFEKTKKIVKWGMEYLKNCHPKNHQEYPNILVGQVGHGETDHNYLGTPEDINMERPAYDRKSKY